MSEYVARATIAGMFPEWPVNAKKSIAADLLRAVIQAHGLAKGKRKLVKVAEETWSWTVGTDDLVYTYNGEAMGRPMRLPKDMDAQRLAFRRDLFAVWEVAVRAASGEAPKAETASEAPAEAPKATEAPKARAGTDALHEYVTWSRSVRALCKSRNADGHALDDWSMRPTLDGVSMLKAGVPVNAVKDAVTMHFPEDARREVGVRTFDFVGHGIARYLETASKARVPLLLIGPKGTGKTSHAMALADALGLPFGMVSMTAGTSPSAFYGRPIIGGDGGVVESELSKIVRNGGVYLFDEMDGADANILLIVNALLANGHFHNPATGEVIERHADTIFVAAMNTMGLGGSRDYVGREKLDAASLDRWGAGRVRVELDESLEDRLVAAIMEGA